ncbi:MULTISPECIES: hypothetical protein [Paenibacillus]|uniref:hypothetical protein n=1 Tax=Paenibacillus TaxID=44249 RepID=UPI0022B91A50|nr:hypothetical protein [Paenibacillus caseinilyticus]MCZ8522720.1 hypothetical protein [Paenibacillus caseinilyticus]
MNDDFIGIKSLQGELKLSHKKRNFGLTVSTQELVYQKPHANFYIKLQDIISITPFELPVGSRPMRLSASSSTASETIHMQDGLPHYRLYVKEAAVHNRSGIFTLGATQFILPIHVDLLRAISRYGGMEAFE